MKKTLLSFVVIMMVTCFMCACTNRDMGTVGGAAIGGVAGNVVTGGSTAGTVAGTVGGGLVGRSVSN